eukprot:TRINITY_DN81238_c0_g1_i1.p1 TRINITY_DN81238_c0_g1~~TRINITY_DN81238_c0_g1_i1.p1  ORF type:complete len:659 (-),score=179.24 TRINITY_DN81238_c0_g1_i1:42-2018(-)
MAAKKGGRKGPPPKKAARTNKSASYSYSRSRSRSRSSSISSRRNSSYSSSRSRRRRRGPRRSPSPHRRAGRKVSPIAIRCKKQPSKKTRKSGSASAERPEGKLSADKSEKKSSSDKSNKKPSSEKSDKKESRVNCDSSAQAGSAKNVLIAEGVFEVDREKKAEKSPKVIINGARPKDKPGKKKAKDKDKDKEKDKDKDKRVEKDKDTPKDNHKKSEKDGTSEAGKQKGGKEPDSSPVDKEESASPKEIQDPASTKAAVPEKKKASLGDLLALQKKLEEDRSRLQLFVINAKKEHEEKLENEEKKARREKEYYQATLGEPCGPGNRFLVEEEIGKGAFSTVYRIRDVTAREGKAQDYAVKFVRMNAMLRQATDKEVKMYRRLRNQASVEDPEGARHIMNLGGPETFEHQGHLAVVFPLQRCDMRFGLKKYGQGKGLPLQMVELYAKCLFLALRALRKVKVIHSDVKPENLLLSLDKMSVKLADFGSAMDVTDRVRTDDVQPRYYRSPEVILGQSYSTQIDVWSAGCTLHEFATGKFLFLGETNNEMLASMLKLTGAFPKAFAKTGEFAGRHFDVSGDFRRKDGSFTSGEEIMPMSDFPKAAKPFVETLTAAAKETGSSAAKVPALADLLVRLTICDPEKRIFPKDALEHPFFQKLGQAS